MAKKTDVTKSSKKEAGKEKKKGGIRKYFRELKAEIKKVVWPTRQQVTKNTGVVLTVMVVMALFLFGVDSGLGAAIKAILKIGA
ncbi:preprotein translocase subunit SecE [Ruminococcus sp.]|uniref:preprotein translocase subunit SecE n=1 Tax=Ruminococcus sp. TaxID=41978 RepID=UPI0025D65341|nr:preprotein translocase subunit SecE [Ruminococcus sp.]